MKCILTVLFLVAALPLVSYRAGKDIEQEKYLNFVAAIENGSTFSYFTVVRVKNVNTGEVKEICTKGNFLAGALHRELKIGYDHKGLQAVLDFGKNKKDRYFEFKHKEALDNISFFGYDIKLVDKLKAKYDFEKIVAQINKDKKFSMMLPDDQMKAFAHILFNKGYLTGESNCFGGTLMLVDRNAELFR
jgi:hypothetical protein